MQESSQEKWSVCWLVFAKVRFCQTRSLDRWARHSSFTSRRAHRLSRLDAIASRQTVKKIEEPKRNKANN